MVGKLRLPIARLSGPCRLTCTHAVRKFFWSETLSRDSSVVPTGCLLPMCLVFAGFARNDAARALPTGSLTVNRLDDKTPWPDIRKNDDGPEAARIVISAMAM